LLIGWPLSVVRGQEWHPALHSLPTMKVTMRSHLRVPLLYWSLGLFAALSPSAPLWGGPPLGIGVMGDSYSDEYEFYPPHRSRARNWVEILARARGLNFGAFSTASRGEPRNQGFAYNWARTEAETSDLIRDGQHLGLARQVAHGEVGVVVIFIGGNDFIHALASEERERVVDQVLDRAIANLDIAVKTILDASPKAQVCIATLPDILELPMFAAPVRAGRLSPRVASAFSKAISRYNWHIRRSMMANPRIALVDLALATQLAPRPDAGHVVVAGRRLDWVRPANDVNHAFLADSRHISTLVQGMLANYVISTLNARLDARIKPLTLREILEQDPGASLDSAALAGPFRAALGPLGREILGLALGVRLGVLVGPAENN
jgi:GDSL-like Lipase/Acylhydrolase